MDYIERLKGRFIGIMQWDDYHALFDKLNSNPNDWYLYDTLKVAPKAVVNASEFIDTLSDIKKVIKSEHQERYCGIVYTNDLDSPDFVKIFHPNNLGKVCGSGENPPIPRWLLSKDKPMDIETEFESKKAQGFVSKYLKF
ncbi:conserved hypothetical protein [Isorropodon fossajaponicum endosymbiont JTNG4]|uniref:hypothetical protein n=1 Tax=Isorropodon fossajaponicum symbiont TaxID=883811 RepID=UPI001916261A|nr:hypothetical protein [Isorropodon fossajaponicum symbiont]BBB24261.1 conserved hypothetical protein [Isorropodon fossajaponicum endosymbiont JTNG4]